MRRAGYRGSKRARTNMNEVCFDEVPTAPFIPNANCLFVFVCSDQFEIHVKCFSNSEIISRPFARCTEHKNTLEIFSLPLWNEQLTDTCYNPFAFIPSHSNFERSFQTLANVRYIILHHFQRKHNFSSPSLKGRFILQPP